MTTLLTPQVARQSLFSSTPEELDDLHELGRRRSRRAKAIRLPLLPLWAAAAGTGAVLRFAGFMLLLVSLLLDTAARTAFPDAPDRNMSR